MLGLKKGALHILEVSTDLLGTDVCSPIGLQRSRSAAQAGTAGLPPLPQPCGRHRGARHSAGGPALQREARGAALTAGRPRGEPAARGGASQRGLRLGALRGGRRIRGRLHRPCGVRWPEGRQGGRAPWT